MPSGVHRFLHGVGVERARKSEGGVRVLAWCVATLNADGVEQALGV